MCFKTPKPPAVRSAPQKDVNASLVQDSMRRASMQQGVYDNISTSPLGDSEYGTYARKLAKLGGR